DSAAQRARAGIGRDEAGQDLQQRGLAGAVGADETGLVALEQPERQAVEERPGRVRLADGLATEQERARHPSLLLRLGLLLFLPHAGSLRHELTPSHRTYSQWTAQASPDQRREHYKCAMPEPRTSCMRLRAAPNLHGSGEGGPIMRYACLLLVSLTVMLPVTVAAEEPLVRFEGGIGATPPAIA